MAKLELESCKDLFYVREFSVRERMSEPFEVAIVALSPNHDVNLEDVVGKGAGLIIPGGLGVLGWTGVCAHMEQLEIELSETGRSTYFLRVVPSLWLLTQRRNHRIFQHQTVRDIVRKVLSEYRVQVAFELIDDPPPLEYRVQYGESDFAFVSRLLEEAGISYYFERHVAGEKTEGGGGSFSLNTRMVCCDNPDFNMTMGEIPYRPEPNESHRKTAFVTKVSMGHRTRPGKFTFHDYNFRNPNTPLLQSSEVKLKPKEKIEEPYEHFQYFHGSSLIEVRSANDKKPVADSQSMARHDEKELKARAQRAAEAKRHEKRQVRFESNEPSLCPGQVLSISEHPRRQKGLGPGDKLLVIESSVEGSLEGWRLTATAVYADTRYRPEVRTPRPRIEGPQTAIVVGEPGKEIHTDEFGRVRVRFHWDREGAFDDKSSCWLRVSQAWAGSRFGSMLIPRVGQEVIVDFFEGNPDQPVVIGRVYNATTKVPRELPKHKTQSLWRSATSPHEDNSFHEIMFDDEAGKELVFIQSQRDLLKLVKGKETERTGEIRTVVVGEARVAGVAAADTTQVGKQRLVKMVGVKDLHIPDMGEPDVTPKNTWIEMADGRISLTTGDATVVLDRGNIGIQAKGGIRFTADGRLIMKGGPYVYLNDSYASVTRRKADKQVKDLVPRPDRMIGSIEKLFWQKPVALTLSRKEITMSVTTAESIAAMAAAPGNKPEQIAARRKVAEDFYREEGYKLIAGKRARKLTADEIRNQIKCIDLNQPVVAAPPPDWPPVVEQWQAPAVPLTPGGPLPPRSQGCFYAPPGSKPDTIGIGPDGTPRDDKGKYMKDASGKWIVMPKTTTSHSTQPDASGKPPPYLRSIASPASDTWSIPDKPQYAPGGGVQFYCSRPDQLPIGAPASPPPAGTP
jgi:type VI secretion system secreted protein VgrG